MGELPTDSPIRALVFGRGDSGKSTFALSYAAAVLRENPEGACLIFASKGKAERKLVIVDDMSISDRILYRWVHDHVSLVQSAARLHLHLNEPLELLIIEDLLDFVNSASVHSVLAIIMNAISVFPSCRLLVTTGLRTEVFLSHFRLSMTHYVNTFPGGPRVEEFPKSLKECREQIRAFLPILDEPEFRPGDRRARFREASRAETDIE
jgi:hypothetical protein